MARMHSRKHGRHGSSKPPVKRHSWMVYEKEEVRKLVEKFSKEGASTARIGTILRDQYGIPDVRVFGLRIGRAAGKENEMEDMHNLMVRAVSLHRHMESNKGDAKARHGLELMESKIRRLGKYYARKGKLPRGWKYSIEEAKLLVK
ncbi:MAG: 30S ribosomal protein S15 [Candidatus Aenigmarchaeota archaeon]|nr:30S ribosomal protein S15 [Candidatus Aenigmarchaeota archaeon]